ncbi:MAG: J domain-containing protein, partial [Candidatus Limnocylindrales bacterium]
MAFDTDPYRTLGLARGASLAEVKRAYRRLAKANHPDAAGEAALPRFLAIRSAYDQIAGPEAGTRGGRGSARADGSSRSGTPNAAADSAPRGPWGADPDR